MNRPCDVSRLEKGFVHTWNAIQNAVFDGYIQNQDLNQINDDAKCPPIDELSQADVVNICLANILEYGGLTLPELSNLYEMTYDDQLAIGFRALSQPMYYRTRRNVHDHPNTCQ